jgi:nucleotide-binding universal stress UspA family protein/nitrite reductase/ring-hydroxylating ferredoxin subunit
LTTYRKIVVGAHGSPTSAIAEQTAAQLAARLGAQLVFIYVSDGSAAERGNGQDILRAAVEGAAGLGVTAQSEHLTGEVATSIMASAADLRADLLVIGDHGMGDANRFSLGGIPDRVAHFSPIDILVARTSPKKRPRPYARVLIATDGSLTAHQAAGRGYSLARALEAGVALVYVGDVMIGDIVLRDTASRLGGEGIDRVVTKGNPAVQISRLAAAGNHDLIVVGNKGMTGSRRYLQRVVPNRIAHEAPVDVLISKTVGRSLFDLRPGEGAVVEIDGERVAAYVADDRSLYTVSARCQHLGCTVGWNSRARTWDCPCHGSRYDFKGGVINGPTTRPLPPVEVDQPGLSV